MADHLARIPVGRPDRGFRVSRETQVQRILVISDGTGGTAEQALRATLTQFDDTEVQVDRRAEVRSEARAREAVEEAARTGAFIVHTVVSKELRNAIIDLCRLHEVEAVDLIGPLLARLAERFSRSPSETPGLYHELNAEYFKRIEAMEFALRHDDGQRVQELTNAEIVILGVSRTFKTPISIYLAQRGWLVGNVPIIMDFPIPPILHELPPARVFGLMTTAARLTTLRQVRHQYLGGSAGHYADLDFVRRELAYARDAYNRRPGWHVIDVTEKPIEEIAAEILGSLRRSVSAGAEDGGGGR
jgi:regulator of PEP synthase PpsR (kinase-PPPase family)